jgi:hypothetical protein
LLSKHILNFKESSRRPPNDSQEAFDVNGLESPLKTPRNLEPKITNEEINETLHQVFPISEPTMVGSNNSNFRSKKSRFSHLESQEAPNDFNNDDDRPQDGQNMKYHEDVIHPLGHFSESPLINLGTRRRMSAINDVKIHLKMMGNLSRDKREKEKFQKQLEIVRRKRLIKMHEKVLKLLGVATRSAKYFCQNETSQSKSKY